MPSRDRSRGRRSGLELWSSVMGRRVSPTFWVRFGTALLWAAVLVAAMGGVAAWLRPAPDPVVVETDGPDASATDLWAVGGFAERFLAAWLSADAESSEELRPFLGYDPQLPRGSGDLPELGGEVCVVDVERVGDEHWAVTAATGSQRTSAGERFWRVEVAADSDGLVAVGLPSPVAAPTPVEGLALGVGLERPPADDPVVDTVEGFVLAHACGGGDSPLDRWLAPGAAIPAVDPPVCSEAELDGWAVAGDEGGDERTVVVEVVLDPRGEAPRRVAYTLGLARRDGRWEVAGLLPAPVDSGLGEVGS